MSSETPGALNRLAGWVSSWHDIYKFLALEAITIFATYYAPNPVKVSWYVIILAAYYFSKNEALWLAVFLAISDGFMSFFGLYTVTFNLLPGLPAMEISQVYIVLTVIKAAGKRINARIFYNKYLQVLFVYLLFSIIWGQMMGLSGELNVYFRVLKGVLPMMLFYSIPRLFVDQTSYDRLFHIIFVIVLAAFAAQLITLLIGLSPLDMAGLNTGEAEEGNRDFRVFFSANCTLIGLFGALYYLNMRVVRYWHRILFYSVVFASLAMAVLSATRGWIIGFSIILALGFLLAGITKAKRIAEFAVVVSPLIFIAVSNPTIRDQLTFSSERLGKMESIAEGDLSAGGTLQRLDLRSNRVMEGWRQNPVFGWGLSDKGYLYGDGHVGNQSLLAMSGVIGFVLLNGFLAFFSIKLINRYFSSGRFNSRDKSLLVFIVFLAGWFFIHSTSGQQFNYVGMPAKIIPQAIFFSFGAFRYGQTMKRIYGTKV